MRYFDKPKGFVRGTKQSAKISTETYGLSIRDRHGQASCSSTQPGEEDGVYWKSIGGVRPVPQAVPLTPGFDNEWGEVSHAKTISLIDSRTLSRSEPDALTCLRVP